MTAQTHTHTDLVVMEVSQRFTMSQERGVLVHVELVTQFAEVARHWHYVLLTLKKEEEYINNCETQILMYIM